MPITIQSLINDQTLYMNVFAKVVKHKSQTYPANVKILEKGKVYPYFLFIRSGRVRVVLNEYQGAGAGPDAIVDEVHENNIVGEMQLFDDKPSHIDVTTAIDTEVIEIDKKTFLQFLESDPKIGYAITVELVKSTVKIVEHMNKAITGLFTNTVLQHKLKSTS